MLEVSLPVSFWVENLYFAVYFLSLQNLDNLFQRKANLGGVSLYKTQMSESGCFQIRIRTLLTGSLSGSSPDPHKAGIIVDPIPDRVPSIGIFNLVRIGIRGLPSGSLTGSKRFDIMFADLCLKWSNSLLITYVFIKKLENAFKISCSNMYTENLSNIYRTLFLTRILLLIRIQIDIKMKVRSGSDRHQNVDDPQHRLKCALLF